MRPTPTPRVPNTQYTCNKNHSTESSHSCRGLSLESASAMNQSSEDPPRILNMIIAIYSTAPRSEHQFAALFRQLAVSDCGPKVPTLGHSIKVPGTMQGD